MAHWTVGFDKLLQEGNIVNIEKFISQQEADSEYFYRYIIFKLAKDDVQKFAIVKLMKIYELVKFNDLNMLKMKENSSHEDLIYALTLIIKNNYSLELFNYLINKLDSLESYGYIMNCIIKYGTLEMFDIYIEKYKIYPHWMIYDAARYNANIFFRLIELGNEIKSDLISEAEKGDNTIVLEYLKLKISN